MPYTGELEKHRPVYNETLAQRVWYTQTLKHDFFSIEFSCTERTLLHREVFTQRSVYTQMILHAQTFARGHLYTEHFLTDPFTQTSFHTHTQPFAHRETFAQRGLYTAKPLHRGTYIHKSFHREVLTQTSCYTQKHFHREVSTERNFYTQRRLDAVHTHRNLSHKDTFTQRSFHILHKEPFLQNALVMSQNRNLSLVLAIWPSSRYSFRASDTSDRRKFAWHHMFVRPTRTISAEDRVSINTAGLPLPPRQRELRRTWEVGVL